MDNKPRQKSSKDSWNDETDKLTNPNRRQEVEQGQRASKPVPDSNDTPSSDRLDDSQGDGQKADTSHRQRQSEE